MTVNRNLGTQPIAAVMEQLQLKPHDLVEASSEQLTHKMVSRAMKGRRLTERTKCKVLRALCGAADRSFDVKELFDY